MKTIKNTVSASLAIMVAITGVATATRMRNGTNLSENGGLRS
jgi:hypothetical protein